MKKLLFATMLLAMLFLVACGPPPRGTEDEAAEEEPAALESAPTPTEIVLATPTPQPAPPTPEPTATPEPPTATPVEEAEAEAETETSAEEAEPTPTEEPTPTPEPEPAVPENMVLIEAGPFAFGQDGSKPKNGPAQTIDLAAYEIDRFEVTNADYAIFADAAGYETYAEANGGRSWRTAGDDKANHPAVYITWNDAQAFCEWAGKRLPTEAEWEKAARGDDGRVYPWGNEFNADVANIKERGIRGTTAVGSFAEGTSPYGVMDMAGNVREWTADFLLPYEGQAADADPYFGEENRVHRGGGWFDGEEGELVATYNRNAGPPEISANDDLGFRCARDVQ